MLTLPQGPRPTGRHASPSEDTHGRQGALVSHNCMLLQGHFSDTFFLRMHRCPYPGCDFKNLQRKNVETHIRIQSVSMPLFFLLLIPSCPLVLVKNPKSAPIASLGQPIPVLSLDTGSGFITTFPDNVDLVNRRRGLQHRALYLHPNPRLR